MSANINIPNAHEKYGDWYIGKALRDAAYLGDLTYIENLIKTYPELDLNLADEYGRTALYIACERQQHKVVDFFLNQPSVDFNAPTILGNSALLISIWNDDSVLAKKLIDAGVDIHQCTAKDRQYHGNVSAMDLALERENHALVSYLENKNHELPEITNNIHPQL